MLFNLCVDVWMYGLSDVHSICIIALYPHRHEREDEGVVEGVEERGDRGGQIGDMEKKKMKCEE
jgi:hypothetical protein